MSSPFSLFRKHQKTMLVLLIGLSMLSFVIFGTMSQASDFTGMPPTLIVLSIAAFAACIAWVAGIRSHKSSEYGSIGLIAGAAIGLVFVMQGGPAPAVIANEFSLTRNEVEELARTRFVANRFVYHAVDKTSQMPSNELKGMMIQNYSFGFDNRGDATEQDLVLGELLRREAKRIGMSLSDAAVTEYINRITDKKMTPELFTEIRQEMNVSERELFDSLRKELLARETANLLYSQVQMPPQQAWEFSKRLQVRQSATVAKVPVEPFIDPKAEPTPAQLQELFTTYRQNQPGFTAEGRPEEGRPGFFQMPRVNLAYLQPDYLAFEKLAEKEITDAAIQARYERDYLTPPETESLVPSSPGAGPTIPGFDMPVPNFGRGIVPPSPGQTPPATETPSSEAAPVTPGTPASPEAPATPETPEPATEDAPQTPPAQPAPAEETPAAPATPPAPEPAPQPETPAESEATTDECGGSGCDEAPEAPKEAPAAATETAPAADAPAANTPAAADEAKPAASSPETTPSPEQPAATPAVPPAPADAPAAGSPDAAAPAGDDEPLLPEYTPPPLDDELKMTIRDNLLREKTAELIERAISDALEKIRNEIGRDVNAAADSAERLTPKQGTERIKKYAAEHNLIYNETGLLTFEQLLQSEDHPIGPLPVGRGSMQSQPRSVAQDVFSTSAKDLFRPRMVQKPGEDGSVEDWFVFWKLEHEQGYVPEDMSEPEIREQVVKTWREMQAREAAQKRAREIAEQVRGSEEPMMDLLSDVTITGEPDAPVLSLTETGQFSWMRQNIVPSPNPFQRFDIVPELSRVAGLEEVGSDFMEVVFNELKEGDVGVAPSRDRKHYYVVKINNRIPSDDAQWEIVRNNFLAGQYSSLENRMSGELMARYIPFWPEQLMERYDVQFQQPASGSEQN